MKENWKGVMGFPDYDVSNKGRVRSWKNNRNGRRKRPKINKQNISKVGYSRIGMLLNNKPYIKFVHRLVLEAFVGPRGDGQQACHGNGVKTDNRVENLRWDSQENNYLDRVKHGTSVKGSKNGQSKLKEIDIPLIRRLIRFKWTYRKIGHMFGVHSSTIKKINLGVTWTHVKEL